MWFVCTKVIVNKHVEQSKSLLFISQLASSLRTIENHGNTEITEAVIFVKCHAFVEMLCFAMFFAKML